MINFLLDICNRLEGITRILQRVVDDGGRAAEAAAAALFGRVLLRG